MSDPATPATADDPTAQPPPATPEPAPAAVPAASPAPVSEPAEDPMFTNATPVNYLTADGASRKITMGELLESHQQLEELGDLQQVRDLQGALNEDPAAQKRLYQAAIDKLDPATSAEGTTTEATMAMLDRISKLEQAAERSNRVVQSAEDQEFNNVLASVIKNPQVAAAYPEFEAHPEVAFHVTGKYLKQARAAANGNSVSNQALKAALDTARAEMVWLAKRYEQNPAGAPGVPGPTPAPTAEPLVAGQVHQPATVTGVDLLRQPQAPQAAVAAAPQNVPAPGGAPGTGVAPAAPLITGPITRTELLDKIRGQKRAGGAQ